MNTKNNTFDFLRFFASFSVIVLHTTGHFNTNFLWFSNGDNTWFYDGVLLFFVISGFLIYKSCEKCAKAGLPITAFYRNRLLRVAPAVYFYLIIMSLLLIVTGIINISQIASKDFLGWFMSTLFFIPVYTPTVFRSFGVGAVNGSLWTIPVEMSFYFILPFLIIVKKKIGNKGFWILSIAISIIGMMGSLIFSGESIIGKLYGVTFLPYLCVFMFGAFLGEYWYRIPKKTWCFILSIVIYYAMFLLKIDILNKFKFIPLAYAVIWFGFEGKPRNILNKVTKFGDASFGMYIWHMVIINFFIHYGIDKKITGTMLVLIVLILSYVMSMISWWLIEKPALKLKKYSLISK